MVVLGQIPVCASKSTAWLLQLSPDSSLEWTSETVDDKSFKAGLPVHRHSSGSP